jgi:hypothetical protein
MGSCTSRVVLVGLLALAAAPAGAQSYTRQQAEPAAHAVEISPFAGLFWSTSVNTSSGPVYLDPTWDVGATLGFPLDGKSTLEILYLYARPQARFVSTDLTVPSSPAFPVTTQYVQVGGTASLGTGIVEPHLSGGLGVAWFHPSTFDAEDPDALRPADTFTFSFFLGLGARWWISESIGLRAEARFLMPVYFSSGAFLSGSNGAALVVNAGIPIVQGDLTLSLVIAP